MFILHIFQPGDGDYILGETHGYIMNNVSPTGISWGCMGTATGINAGTGANNTMLIATQCPLSVAKYWKI